MANIIKIASGTFDDAAKAAKISRLDKGVNNSGRLTKKISQELEEKSTSGAKKLVKKSMPTLLDTQDLQDISNNILTGISGAPAIKSIRTGVTPTTKNFQGLILSGNSMKVDSDLALNLQRVSAKLNDPDIDNLSKIVTAAYQSNVALPEEFVKDVRGIITGVNFKADGTTSKASIRWENKNIAAKKKQELKQCYDTVKSGDYVVDIETYDRLQRNGQSIKVGNEDILPYLRSQFNEDTPRILDYHTRYGLDLSPVTDLEYADLEKYGTIPDRFKVTTLDSNLLQNHPQSGVWEKGQEQFQRLAVIRNYLSNSVYPGHTIGFTTDYLVPDKVIDIGRGQSFISPVESQFKRFTDSSGNTQRLQKKLYYQTDAYGNALLDSKGNPIFGETSKYSPIGTVFSVDGYQTKISALTPTPNRIKTRKITNQIETELRDLANQNPEFFIKFTEAVRTGGKHAIAKLTGESAENQKLANAILKELGKINELEFKSSIAGQIHHFNELTKQAAELLVKNDFDVQKVIEAYPEYRKQTEYLRDMVLLPQILHTGPFGSAHNFEGLLPTSKLGQVAGQIRVGGGTNFEEVSQRILDNIEKGKRAQAGEFVGRTKHLIEKRRGKDQTLKEKLTSTEDLLKQLEQKKGSAKKTTTKKHQKLLARIERVRKLQDANIDKYLQRVAKTEAIKESAMSGIISHFGENDYTKNIIEQLLSAKFGGSINRLISKNVGGGYLKKATEGVLDFAKRIAEDSATKAPKLGLKVPHKKIIIANETGDILQEYEQLENGVQRLIGQLDLKVFDDFIEPHYIENLSKGEAKGISRDLYDAAIALHKKPLRSGKNLLTPKATENVWSHYFDKEVVSTRSGIRGKSSGKIVMLNQPSQKITSMKSWNGGTVINFEKYKEGERPMEKLHQTVADSQRKNYFDVEEHMDMNSMQRTHGLDEETAAEYEALLYERNGGRLVSKHGLGSAIQDLGKLLTDTFGGEEVIKELAKGTFEETKNAFGGNSKNLLKAMEEALPKSLEEYALKENESVETILEIIGVPELLKDDSFKESILRNIKRPIKGAPKGDFNKATVFSPKPVSLGKTDIFGDTPIHLDFKNITRLGINDTDKVSVVKDIKNAKNHQQIYFTPSGPKVATPNLGIEGFEQYKGAQVPLKVIDDKELKEFKQQILAPTAAQRGALDDQVAYLERHGTAGIVERPIEANFSQRLSTRDGGFARINESTVFNRMTGDRIKQLLVHENLGHGLEDFLSKSYISSFKTLPGMGALDQRKLEEVRAVMMETKFFLWREAKRIAKKDIITPEELNEFISKVPDSELKELVAKLNHRGYGEPGDATMVAKTLSSPANIKAFKERLGTMLGIAGVGTVGLAAAAQSSDPVPEMLAEGGTITLSEPFYEEIAKLPVFRHLPNSLIADQFKADLNKIQRQLTDKDETKLQKKYNLSYKQLQETLEDFENQEQLVPINKQGGNLVPKNISGSVLKKVSYDDLLNQFIKTTKISANNIDDFLKFKKAKNLDDRFMAGQKLSNVLDTKNTSGLLGHGVAKATSDAEALARVRMILTHGTNPEKTFYIGPLSKTSENIGAGIGTASGKPYMDGPFVLIHNATKNTSDPKAFTHVLVNDSFENNLGKELAEKYKAVLQKEFPDVKVLLYSEVQNKF